MTTDPLDVAVCMARALEESSIPYVIGGSIASTLHGEPRTSVDVDFAIQLRHAGVEPFVQRVQPDFFVQAESVAAAVEHHTGFNAIHRRAMFKVDLYVRPASGLFGSEIERAERILLRTSDPGPVRVASAEDTVLQELRSFRAGGDVSERQWRDVRGILKARAGRLDMQYLRQWAQTLQLEVLLERAVAESGP